MERTTSPEDATEIPRAVDGPVRELWKHLARPTAIARAFEESLVADLPEPARRWLTRSIAVGTPLARAVVLEMQGHIRLGRWLPFGATEVLAPPEGFVWQARAGWGPVSIRGYDRYGDGTGEMRWRLGGFVPFMHAEGADIGRSTAGRLAAEAVLVPTAVLGPAVSWHAGAERDIATAEWRIGSHRLRADLHVDGDGSARVLTMQRWGNPIREPFGEYSFAAVLDDEVSFDGITIPTKMVAGWFFGTERWAEGEFFRARITSARFL